MEPNDPRSSFSNDDLDYVRGRYQKRIAEHGVNFHSMNSGTEDKQRRRHSIHADLVSPDARVLDIGCGIGQFYEFLLGRGYKGAYTGIDIVPEYIADCRRRFPQGRFELRNVFEQGLDGRYDVITASQVFNVKYPRAGNLEIMRRFLEMAFERSDYAVSVDMLSSYVDYNEEHLYYFSPELIFQHAKTLSRFVRLRHDYLPYEFSIQIFR